MEYLITGTTTHTRPSKSENGAYCGETIRHARQFPPFVILDPDNLRSQDAVRHLAWRMIGEPGDFTLIIEPRIQPPCDECRKLAEVKKTSLRAYEEAVRVQNGGR